MRIFFNKIQKEHNICFGIYDITYKVLLAFYNKKGNDVFERYLCTSAGSRIKFHA